MNTGDYITFSGEYKKGKISIKESVDIPLLYIKDEESSKTEKAIQELLERLLYMINEEFK